MLNAFPNIFGYVALLFIDPNGSSSSSKQIIASYEVSGDIRVMVIDFILALFDP